MLGSLVVFLSEGFLLIETLRLEGVVGLDEKFHVAYHLAFVVSHGVEIVFVVKRLLLKSADGVFEVECLSLESRYFKLFVIAMLTLGDCLSAEFLDLDLLLS